METIAGEGKTALQIFGSNESDFLLSMRGLGRETEQRFCEINLNAGCPMTRITREGAGAKLVENPEKVYRLLRIIKENTSLPVTLKTRLGPHPGKTMIFELVSAAESAGASGVIVHARYTSQMHGGPTGLETLAEVVAKSSLPITGNGSVVDRKSAQAMAATGVDAIMIGRAALGDPYIFSRIKAGSQIHPFSGSEICRRHLKYILEFQSRLSSTFPDDHIPSPDAFAAVKMHTHLFRYFNGRPGAAKLRARLNTVRSIREIESVLAGFENGDGG